MPSFRSIFFFSKHPSLLQRFHPSNIVSSTKYSTLSKYIRKGPKAPHVSSVNEHGLPSWAANTVFAMMGFGIMSFAGFATFVDVKNERRAVLKGLGIASRCLDNEPVIHIDTQGIKFTEKNPRLYFVYSASSPDVVQEQRQIVSKAIDILESRHNLKVLPVFVPFDPEVVVPSHLRAYLKEFDPRNRGLPRPVVAIGQMRLLFHDHFEKIEEEGGNNSSHKMYMLSPNLETLMCFGIEYNAEELSEAMLNVVQKAPQGSFGTYELYQMFDWR